MRGEAEEGPSASSPSRMRTVPFLDEWIEVIADTLDTRLTLAPFQLPGAKIYQLTVEGVVGRSTAMITLWPSLRRVDAIGSGAAVVFTRIATVQLVPGIEVIFRRESGEYLVVAVGGKIVVRS